MIFNTDAEANGYLERIFRRDAGPAQTPPGDDWRTWLFMGGRGAGKTWAGAHWVMEQVWTHKRRRIALVAPALHDVREVMIHGPSGLVPIAEPQTRPLYQSSRRRLVWPNGAMAFAFSAEDPDSLRGPQFDCAWCDELAAWKRPEETWNMLQFALRLGDRPQAMVTTTPRPIDILSRIMEAPDTITTRAATRDNAKHLAPSFLTAVEQTYRGTHLARQELDGELIDDHPGRFDLGFIDAGAAYQTGRVTLWDSTGDPALATEASLPLVMSAEQAQLHLKLMRDQLDGNRHRQHIAVPFSDVAIEAGDILALEDGKRFQVRSVSDGLVRSLDLADFRQNRLPIVSMTDTPLAPVVPKAGVPELIIIDAPPDPDIGDDIRPLIAVSMTPWTAPVDVSAGADIASLTLRTVVTQPAAIGRLLTDLPAGLADRWDYGSVISVAFDDAQLASVSALAALEDAALIAVETDTGWEFLAFQQAELQFDGSYELKCLLRGRRGTEAAMRSGADAGARCVVIDDAVVRADFGSNERGLQRLWRAEAREAGAPARTVETTINGIAIKPSRPGHVRTRQLASGDMQITWTRRTRWGGDSWSDYDVPLHEAVEQYELVFKRSGEVLRTETTLAPSFTYSLSDQSADGAPGEVVTVSVAQVSARVGPGEATTIDITL